jgi:hypothetical protein
MVLGFHRKLTSQHLSINIPWVKVGLYIYITFEMKSFITDQYFRIKHYSLKITQAEVTNSIKWRHDSQHKGIICDIQHYNTRALR